MMHRPEDRTGNICLHGRVGRTREPAKRQDGSMRTHVYVRISARPDVHASCIACQARLCHGSGGAETRHVGFRSPQYVRSSCHLRPVRQSRINDRRGRKAPCIQIRRSSSTYTSQRSLSFSVTAAGPSAAPQRAPAPGCRGRPACGPRWRPLDQHTHLLRDPHACIVIIVVLTTLTGAASSLILKDDGVVEMMGRPMDGLSIAVRTSGTTYYTRHGRSDDRRA